MSAAQSLHQLQHVKPTAGILGAMDISLSALTEVSLSLSVQTEVSLSFWSSLNTKNVAEPTSGLLFLSEEALTLVAWKGRGHEMPVNVGNHNRLTDESCVH